MSANGMQEAYIPISFTGCNGAEKLMFPSASFLINYILSGVIGDGTKFLTGVILFK